MRARALEVPTREHLIEHRPGRETRHVRRRQAARRNRRLALHGAEGVLVPDVARALERERVAQHRAGRLVREVHAAIVGDRHEPLAVLDRGRVRTGNRDTRRGRLRAQPEDRSRRLSERESDAEARPPAGVEVLRAEGLGLALEHLHGHGLAGRVEQLERLRLGLTLDLGEEHLRFDELRRIAGARAQRAQPLRRALAPQSRPARELAHALRGHARRNLLDLAETRLVVEVHRVDAAAADVVVGMVEQQESPRFVHQRRELASACARRDRQRLRHALEQPLRAMVGELEVRARRPDAREDRVVLVAEQLALVQRELRSARLDVVDVRTDRRVHELDLGYRRLRAREQPRQFGLERHVVAAVEQDCCSRVQLALARLQRRAQALDRELDLRFVALEVAELLRMTERRGVEVAVAQVDRRNLAAVAGAPAKFASEALPLVLREPAHEQERAQPQPAQDHRHLRDVTERIRHVAVARAGAELARACEPAPQVADQRLAARQERIGQHEPRTDLEPALAHEPLDPRAVLRPDREIVVERRRLAVERERAEAAVALEQVEQPVDELDQVHPILLEREVPRPIPVRVGHDKPA